MTRENIISALQNKGYNAVAQETIKNGVTFEGIVIREESSIVSPVIYTDSIIKNAMDIEDAVSRILSIFEEHKNTTFNINNLSDSDYILSHLRIGLQKESSEDLIKMSTEFEGIESYLYIRDDVYSIKVKEQLLNNVHIDIEVAWQIAKDNTFKETKIVSMAKVIADLTGFDYSEEMEEQIPFYILSNTDNIKGSANILDRESLKEFAESKQTTKLLVLPSSTEEMIICPFEEGMNIDDFSEMVASVNLSEVSPEQRLTNKAYVIQL